MSFELGLFWVIHGALVVLLAGMLISSLGARRRSKLAYRFSNTVQLPLATEAIAAAAERRIVLRNTAMMTGGLLGLMISALVILLNQSVAAATTISLITLPLVLAGICAGGALVAVRESLFPRHPDAVRVARPITATLHDYVSPRRLRTPLVLVLVALAACLTGLALGATGLIDSATFLASAALPTLAVALLVTVFSRLSARQVLSRPQPATSELELAWDDAFRAETFRALWMFASVISWLAVAAAGLGMLQALDAVAGTTWALGLGSQLFTWGFLAIFVGFGYGGAQRYFRYTLWPELSLASAT